jgi:hypothetical protein
MDLISHHRQRYRRVIILHADILDLAKASLVSAFYITDGRYEHAHVCGMHSAVELPP